MKGSGEPPSKGEGARSRPEKQIVPCTMNTRSRQSSRASLGGFLKAVLRAGQWIAGAVYARVTSARALSIIAVALASIAVFLGPIGLPGSAPARLDASEWAIKRIEMRLAAAGLSRPDAVNPTTLLVAVQFVTAAAERSAPFDTALAVAISMIGEHPKIGPLLDGLLDDAEKGVPSLDTLRADFQARLVECEKNGLLKDAPAGSGQSPFRLSRLWPWNAPETSTEYQALRKLSADVEDRQLAQAMQLVAKLDGRLRDALESWREQAQRRIALDGLLAELRRAAFVDLIGDAS
jgi:hypothetical protein